MLTYTELVSLTSNFYILALFSKPNWNIVSDLVSFKLLQKPN